MTEQQHRTETRFCKNCLWAENGKVRDADQTVTRRYKCRRPISDRQSKVDGEYFDTLDVDCRVERGEIEPKNQPLSADPCGPNGKHWADDDNRAWF